MRHAAACCVSVGAAVQMRVAYQYYQGGSINNSVCVRERERRRVLLSLDMHELTLHEYITVIHCSHTATTLRIDTMLVVHARRRENREENSIMLCAHVRTDRTMLANLYLHNSNCANIIGGK